MVFQNEVWKLPSPSSRRKFSRPTNSVVVPNASCWRTLWYTAWAAGQKGGEAAIEKLGRGRFVKRATAWAKRNGVLSVGIVALLPPPVPLLPVVVAAGALGLTRGRFLASYGTARLLRYSFIGWLGYTYGRRVVSLWQKDLKAWMTPILTLYVAMVVLVAAYGLWKYFRERNKRN